ncbi:MAG TPA: putative 2OG-Fe(II) oxygenase, partial [Rhodanobacteraceae bacterium]|nr:putative 2OG-Fe(II) oxygenase [Rhodanobacteraceae bacterium]
MYEVHGLFPTPFMRASRVLPGELVSGLIEHFSAMVDRTNNSSPNLTHTALLQPGDSPLLVAAAGRITPLLGEFGTLLFGQRLGWSLKEMWVNVLDRGGRQAMHNHANSFISGVVYLTHTHAEARTVFMKSPGGTGFAFKNDHAGVTPCAYSADKWISPPSSPGDVVLFPS